MFTFAKLYEQEECVCSDMISQQEGVAFFSRLLQGLLSNLSSQGGSSGDPQQATPLQAAAKDVLAATCQLLGPERFLQQVLQSVEGLGAGAQQLNASQLEVRFPQGGAVVA